METFRPEKVHYFRAKIDATRPRSFDDVVGYFQRECALSRGGAIVAARKTCPDLYNQFHARVHNQAPSSTAARGSGGEKPTQMLSVHTARFVRFKGL